MSSTDRPDADAAVVLVHGTRTSSSQWDPQRAGLRAAGFAVITPDLPGHGARIGEPFTAAAATAAIVDAVRSAGERPTHLVGQSLGGMLAIHAAGSRGGELPRLASVIACGAAVQPGPRGAAAYGRVLAAVDHLPGGGPRRAPARDDGFAPKLPDLTRVPGVLTAVLGRRGSRAYLRGGRPGPEVLSPAMRAVAGLDLRADLARITVPVIILSPRFDQLRRHERSFAAAAPRGRLEVLPYGTHTVNLGRPRRFTRDLVRLLREVQVGS